MIKLHNLTVAEGSLHASKRVGRGLGSGMGKTSTRGQKGAGARSGGAINPGFEGGQLPIYRRLPKRGFKSLNRIEYKVVDLQSIDIVEEDTIDLTEYFKEPVKVLNNGEIKSKKTVIANAFSASAKAAIEKAGGKCILASDKGASQEEDEVK